MNFRPLGSVVLRGDPGHMTHYGPSTLLSSGTDTPDTSSLIPRHTHYEGTVLPFYVPTQRPYFSYPLFFFGEKDTVRDLLESQDYRPESS